MPKCENCDDQLIYDWYADQKGNWKLGIQLDVNSWRPHICEGKKITWIKCEKCPSNFGWFNSEEKLKDHTKTYHPNGEIILSHSLDKRSFSIV